jgi:diaminopropionate ammonia-lyase
MSGLIPQVAIRAVRNPKARAEAAYGPELQAILSEAGQKAARDEISAWPGYAPTPLVSLPGLAAAAGIRDLWYKDEGGRFGLGSFKALGGAYAVGRLLTREVEAKGGVPTTTAELRAGKHRDIAQEITVCTATDGNHGRSVAWGAQLFGCNCIIYIPGTVSEGRKAAMERFGADVRRVEGNYDDSVRQIAEDAERNGWFLVSDTSHPGYTEIPCDVMHGYTVMAGETIQQFPDGATPTHVFVQGGVGGLAAAVCACFWQTYGSERPRLVIVEPDKAACFYESARAGSPVTVMGDLDTVMGGLAAGEVSLVAWDLLWAGAEAFLTVPDEAAVALMRLLAEGVAGDPPIVAGESAVAGLAGLLGALDESALARDLGLGADSRVLVFGSEGATDPELYQAIVGRPAEEIKAA